MGQGRDNARQFLRDNPDVLSEIREKVLAFRLPKPDQEADAQGKPKSRMEKDLVKTPAGVSNKRPARTATVATSRKR
jgi:hypothetical protein